MKMSPRAKMWIGIAATLLLIVIVLGYPDAVHFFKQEDPPADPAIPRSFSGNRLAYGLALFSLFSTSSLAIRKLILIGVQLSDRTWREDPDVGYYRMALASLLMVIVLGAAPDVVILLLYGEAGDRTLTALMTVDRLFDGLTIIPFTMAIMFHVKADQFQRTPSHGFFASFQDEQPAPRARKLYAVVPRRETIAENVKIIVGVMAIAAGLALLK